MFAPIIFLAFAIGTSLSGLGFAQDRQIKPVTTYIKGFEGVWNVKPVSDKDSELVKQFFNKDLVIKYSDGLWTSGLYKSSTSFAVEKIESNSIFLGRENAQKVSVSFTISGPEKLVGHMKVGPRELAIEAVRRKVLFVCSNHNPTHSAESKDELESQTKKNGCAGWKAKAPK